MVDIFMSYAREDTHVVRELVSTFEQQGLSVFWDRDTAIGEEFERRIEQALADARSVVVVWSKHSVESPWVRGEAHEGLDRRILVPVRLDESRLPLAFRGLEAAHLGEWPNRTQLVEQRKVIEAIRLLCDDSNSLQDRPIPIRDDPTISVRVAERVVHALEEDRASKQEVEGLLADAAFAMLNGEPRRDVTRQFVEKLAMALSCDVAAIRSENGKTLVIFDRDEDTQDQMLEDLLNLPTDDGIQLISTNNEGKLHSANWCLRIDSAHAAQLVLACTGTAEPPSSRVIGRLAYATQFLTLDD